MRNVAAVRVKPYFFWKFFVDLKKRKKVREKFAFGDIHKRHQNILGGKGISNFDVARY